MVLEPIHCPSCNSTNVVKNGKSAEGKQRYRCRNDACHRRSFILDYSYRGYLPEVKQQISDMAINGSGIRDTARVLKISPTTVIEELKKNDCSPSQVNTPLLETLKTTPNEVSVYRVEDAEMDEMWSFVGSKQQQRWLWHAVDHQTGQLLAYVLAPHEDAVVKHLKILLAPFHIQHFYTDDWGTYKRHLDEWHHTIGKTHTQKIERKHLTMRTRIKRLARKTICFSSISRYA